MSNEMGTEKKYKKLFDLLTRREVDYFIMAIVLIIACYVRFATLSINPGWYSDEGTLVDIAINLLEGKNQYLVINQSTLLAARLPVFPMLLAGIFAVAEPGITTLRFTTAILSVFTIGLLYWVVRDILGKERSYLAIGAAFFLAIYPEAILYSRLGFSYNLLSPLVVGMVWFLWKYLETNNLKWILLASLLVGIGSLSDLMMFTVAPIVVIIAIFKSWKDSLLSAGVIVLPFILYSLGMMSLSKEAFLFDFKFTFFRLGKIPLVAQYPYIIFNYAVILLKDFWWSLAIVGMFLIPEKRFRDLSLVVFFMPLTLLARTAALPGLGFYYLIPLFPMIALGAASLVAAGTPYVLSIIRRGLEKFMNVFIKLDQKGKLEPIWKPIILVVSSLVLFLVIFSPFVISLSLGVYQARTGLRTDIDPVMVDVQDAQRAISFINQRLDPDDVVLASPALAWAIESRAADFQMAIAAEGGETQHFPADIPSDRFEFNPEYGQVDYVIMDPIWINWAVPNMPEVAEMVQDVKNWPKIYHSGLVEIYENPVKDNK